jgi:WhiB family transcriptional regulator, redox-sensing transcriptional regulator
MAVRLGVSDVRIAGICGAAAIRRRLRGQAEGLWLGRGWFGHAKGSAQDKKSEVPMTEMDNRPGWWSRAACASADPDLFFPISHSGPALRQVMRAKAVCAHCDIQRECLGYALAAGSIQGVWGGMTEEERRRLRRRNRRARVPSSAERVGVPVRVPEAARAR